jgi:hypothetical protein
MYLRSYGSVWPEDDFFKSKLVASLHIDNELMFFSLILILCNQYQHIGMAPIKILQIFICSPLPGPPLELAHLPIGSMLWVSVTGIRADRARS